MPNPKRRHSKRRTSTRRAHDYLNWSSVGEVPELPRNEAAPSGLPELWTLQGQGRQGNCLRTGCGESLFVAPTIEVVARLTVL